MKKQNRTGTRLFFIEFLIVLFFFLIVGTVCLKLFVHAHQITERAEVLSAGQLLTSSIAEVLETTTDSGLLNDTSDISDQLYGALQELWPEGTMDSGNFVLTYDRDFESCEPKSAYYTVSVSITSADRSAAILVADNTNDIIYDLSVALHLPLTYKEVLS